MMESCRVQDGTTVNWTLLILRNTLLKYNKFGGKQCEGGAAGAAGAARGEDLAVSLNNHQ
jgi:hypothetical protein